MGSRKPDMPGNTPDPELSIAKPDMSPEVRHYLDNLQAQISKILGKYDVSNFNELQTLGESDPNAVSGSDIKLLTKLSELVGLAVRSDAKFRYAPINLENISLLTDESGQEYHVKFQTVSGDGTTIVSFEPRRQADAISTSITQGVLIGVSSNPDPTLAMIEAEADLLERLEEEGLTFLK